VNIINAAYSGRPEASQERGFARQRPVKPQSGIRTKAVTTLITVSRALEIVGEIFRARPCITLRKISISANGMNCLLEKLGVIETEIFISHLLREPFDYTAWQQKHFADISVRELNRQAVNYAKTHPFESQNTV
jgi:hypothetical protein